MSQSVLIGVVVVAVSIVALAIVIASTRSARNKYPGIPAEKLAAPPPPTQVPATSPTPAPATSPAPATPPPTAAQAVQRPTAHVDREAVERTVATVHSRPQPSHKVALTGAPVLPRRREDVPEIVLVTPVEMWLEAGRIGVRAGSPTHDQFVKYANTLLNDLQASRDTSR